MFSIFVEVFGNYTTRKCNKNDVQVFYPSLIFKKIVISLAGMLVDRIDNLESTFFSGSVHLTGYVIGDDEALEREEEDPDWDETSMEQEDLSEENSSDESDEGKLQ